MTDDLQGIMDRARERAEVQRAALPRLQQRIATALVHGAPADGSDDGEERLTAVLAGIYRRVLAWPEAESSKLDEGGSK